MGAWTGQSIGVNPAPPCALESPSKNGANMSSGAVVAAGTSLAGTNGAAGAVVGDDGTAVP
jgi:hypothetical protein